MLVLTNPDEAKNKKFKKYNDIYYPTEKNKPLIESYYQDLVIKGYAPSTILNKLSILRFLSKHYQKDFEDMTKVDIKTLLFKIETGKTLKGKDKSSSCKGIDKQLLKDFLKILYNEDVIKEPFFEIIHAKLPKTTITADDIYTEDEVNAMIGKARNLRDKAFIVILYDVGGQCSG
jgi:site-specific recombinase XerD